MIRVGFGVLLLMEIRNYLNRSLISEFPRINSQLLSVSQLTIVFDQIHHCAIFRTVSGYYEIIIRIFRDLIT